MKLQDLLSEFLSEEYIYDNFTIIELTKATFDEILNEIYLNNLNIILITNGFIFNEIEFKIFEYDRLKDNQAVFSICNKTLIHPCKKTIKVATKFFQTVTILTENEKIIKGILE